MKAKKRVLFLMMSACFMIWLQPVVVRAADTVTGNDIASDIAVADTTLVSGEYYVTAADGTSLSSGSEGNYNVHFVEQDDKCVLTLNNATILGADNYSSGGPAIHYWEDKPLELVLVGTNDVKAHQYASNTYVSYAINVSNALVISGDGILNATSYDTEGAAMQSAAIMVSGDLTIAGGTIVANSGNMNGDSGSSVGILVQDGNIYINGGDITANAGKASAGVSIGIYNGTGSSAGSDVAGNITINGGTVKATGDTAKGQSCGLAAFTHISINGGNISATAGNSKEDNSYGVGATGKLSISGGTVVATGGTSDLHNSFGIGAKGDTSISGATITANGGAAGESSFGIGTDKTLAVTGGTINAVGGAGLCSYGLGTDQNIAIQGGTVNAAGGTATGGIGFGIGAKGIISVTDGGSIVATSAYRAIGAISGYSFGSAYQVYVGNTADTATLLSDLQSDFDGYLYVKAEQVVNNIPENTPDDDSNDDSDDDDTETATAPVTTYVIHIVQSGDTLNKIAMKYGCTVADIMNANSNLIKNPNLIYVGWQLRIPQQSGNVGNTAGGESVNNKFQIYVVQTGDNLWTIARRYGCTVNDIIALNSELITNPNRIFAGWNLKVPYYG